MVKKSQSSKDGRIEEKAYACVKEIIENAGYKIWDVIFEKEGAMWYLRILFDKDGEIGSPGISSEECEGMTLPINDAIDKQDFVEKIDILEIGSPGLTRKLRKPEHFNICRKAPVCVSLRGDGGKTVYKKGLLTAYDEEKDFITVDGEEIPLKKCIKVNLDL